MSCFVLNRVLWWWDKITALRVCLSFALLSFFGVHFAISPCYPALDRVEFFPNTSTAKHVEFDPYFPAARPCQSLVLKVFVGAPDFEPRGDSTCAELSARSAVRGQDRFTCPSYQAQGYTRRCPYHDFGSGFGKRGRFFSVVAGYRSGIAGRGEAAVAGLARSHEFFTLHPGAVKTVYIMPPHF